MSTDEPSLDAVIASSNALIKQLEATVRTDETSQEPPADLNQPNALALVASAATLLKAHTTKLSLLALNEPFTPREMAKIVRSLTVECFTAMVTALQLARPELHSHFLHNLLRRRVSDLLALLPMFFGQLPRSLMAAREAASRQDTLQHTGQIWEICDYLTNLAKPESGLAKAAVTDLTKWRELFKDAVAELEEWREDGAEPLEDGLSVGSDESMDVAEKLEKTRLSPDPGDANRSAALDDARMELADDAVSQLKLISQLYPILTRRRIRTFPPLVGQTKRESFPAPDALQRLDEIVQFGKRATELVDSVAESFYTDDTDAAEEGLQELTVMARRCVGRVAQGWDGRADEFTSWSEQWLRSLDELPFSRRFASRTTLG